MAPIGRRVAGTETGVLLGYLAQRVLGQYDLLVLDDDATPPTPSTTSAETSSSLEKRFAFRPRDFRLWIAIHEVTHRAQFTGVPWMKPYYLSLVESSLPSIDPDPAGSCRRAHGVSSVSSCAKPYAAGAHNLRCAARAAGADLFFPVPGAC